VYEEEQETKRGNIMFDSGNGGRDDDEKPGIEEKYTVATNTSNLRLDVREGSPQRSADIIIAAGWNESRIGGALLRLHTEFDGSVKPRLATKEDFLKPGKTTKDERKAASRRAHEGNLKRMRELLENLHSLQAVREQTTLQMLKWNVQDAERKAVEIVHWWLAQACPECGGTKFQVVPGTGRHSAKACPECLGTGKRVLPHNQEGRRLANFLDQCVERARAGIRRHLHG
jgi:hypothetical protein